MNLSIVIVNYNTKNLLKKCLSSLMEHLTQSSEIIIVDNASTDGSVEMLRKEFPKITLITNKTNRGFGAANNQGAEIAKGKYLLFLNPDAKVERGFDELLGYMEKNQRVGILGCRLMDETGQEHPHIAGFKHNVFSAVVEKISPPTSVILREPATEESLSVSRRSLADAQDDGVATEVDWVTGACMLIRRKVFEELDGFDEQFFMYFEDEDLCLRAKEKGRQVVYYPKFTIEHVGGAALGKDKKSRWHYYFQSQDLFYKKHHGWGQRVLLKILRWPLRTLRRK